MQRLKHKPQITSEIILGTAFYKLRAPMVLDTASIKLGIQQSKETRPSFEVPTPEK